jgi:hypothetical protein
MVGSWILYLLSSPVSLTRYMRETYHIYLEYSEITENVLLPSILTIDPTEVDMYRTVTNKNSEYRNWQILRNVCRFPLRAERIGHKNMDVVSVAEQRNMVLPETDVKSSGFETIQYVTAQGKTMRRKQRIQTALDLSKMDSWMYYASFCPLWLERIQEHRGQICHETQRVWFEEEDDEEAFHSEYDLEPDEQPRSVQETILSPPVYHYISWKSFYEMYGSNSHLRQVSIRRDRQGNWSRVV